MSELESRYPCEDGTADPKRHKLRKGQGQELARGVDCAIEARDQWMRDLTDWLTGLQNEVKDLRQRLAACEKACECGKGEGGAPQVMMALKADPPPPPPKDWP